MLQDTQEDVIERELNRAINRTDFFRAFKMHAKYYELGSFLVFRTLRFYSREHAEQPMFTCRCLVRGHCKP